MASRAAKTYKAPVKIDLADGSVFTCLCGSKEFKVTNDEEAPLHLFCRCGLIYTTHDLPPLAGS